MSYSPLTGLVYIPAQENVFSYSRAAVYEHKEMSWNLAQNPDAEMAEGVAEFVNKGYLLAWDPASNSEVWRIAHDKDWNGGVLTTAGNLLVQGAADGRFVIYRADDGELLWETPIHTGAVAGPISYAVDGEQYIAVAAGWAGAIPILGGSATPTHNAPMRILAFKLGGTATLPGPKSTGTVAVPEITASEETIAEGAVLYDNICRTCHGFDVISGGMIPDLRFMSAETHLEFNEIVLEGIRAQQGMASFADLLTHEEAGVIYAYIVTESSKLRSSELQAQ
jgi:mono/diheme cytochrome c family protein